jgi:hypothetical protein
MLNAAARRVAASARAALHTVFGMSSDALASTAFPLAAGMPFVSQEVDPAVAEISNSNKETEKLLAGTENNVFQN